MKILPKKAQLSIFVILGAILIVGMISFLVIGQNNITLFADERNSAGVKEYVESCMTFVGERGVNRLGLTGGWIYPNPGIYTDRKFNQFYNKRAQGLDFLEKVEMPYWYYFDESSENFKFNVPEYDTQSPFSMKNQLKRYLEENFERECIRNFEQFDSRFDIDYDPKLYEFEIEFREDTIDINLGVDLEIREDTTNTSEFISSFDQKIENKIRIPYFLAVDILKSQANTSFIEKRMLNFMNPYQTSSRKDLLPPFYDFRMTYDFKGWNLRDTKSFLKQIISAHMGKVQFLNTDFDERTLRPELRDNEFAVALNNLYTKDYISESSNTKEENPRLFREYKEYKVRPKYEVFFPSFIDISPSMGGEVLLPRPQSIISLIPFFFTEYTSVYEIVMPIVIEIRSQNLQDDFVFNLPIEANINHNSPLKENVEFSFDLDELNPEENELSARSLVCDPAQFVSDYVYLNITDPIVYGERGVNDPVSGVENAIVNFNCKGIATCYVGSTKINGRFEEEKITELKFRLPLNCGPGSLEVYKFGHRKVNIDNIFPSLDKEVVLEEVEMPSEKEVDLRVRLIKSSDSRYTQGRSIRDNERGFLIFELLEDPDVVQVVEVDPNIAEEDLKIKLMPGNYSLNGFLTYDDKITIESKRFCYQKGIFSGNECQIIPELELEAWLSGGIEISSFEVTTKQLLNAKRLTVNLIEYGIPRTYDSLEVSASKMADLDLVSDSKKPYFDFE